MYNKDKSAYDKMFKEAKNCLKTSFFSFKFNPDFLSAVSYFGDAAKGYKQLKLWKESLVAFEETIKCNKKLLESWAEGQNWNEMAEIYIFYLNDFQKGWDCLKNSSYSFKVAGKFTTGMKVYQDAAQKLIENGKYNDALIILKEGYSDSSDQIHDDLIRISLEEIYNKLLDVYCFLESYPDAIELIEGFIKLQKSIKEEKKHKISKNYVKLAMIRIIIDEAYMAEKLIDEMFSVYDSSCSDDIDDLRKLIKSFKDANKKNFGFLITYAYSLFQTNLLKALKKAFDKVELQTQNEMSNNNLNRNVINLNSNFMNDQISENDTKANTMIDNNSQVESEIHRNNPQADDYL